MRRNFALLFSFFILLSMGGSCSSKPHQEAATQQKEIEYYTCSMHPKVHESQMGKCPICHMDLIPVYK